jgi:hypothetical protein
MERDSESWEEEYSFMIRKRMNEKLKKVGATNSIM